MNTCQVLFMIQSVYPFHLHMFLTFQVPRHDILYISFVVYCRMNCIFYVSIRRARYSSVRLSRMTVGGSRRGIYNISALHRGSRIVTRSPVGKYVSPIPKE